MLPLLEEVIGFGKPWCFGNGFAEVAFGFFYAPHGVKDFRAGQQLHRRRAFPQHPIRLG